MDLPIEVLFALPAVHDRRDYVTQIFDLPAALHRLLATESWDDALSAINPHIVAPGWDYDHFARHFRSFQDVDLREIWKRFDISASPRPRLDSHRRYAIQHLSGVHLQPQEERLRRRIIEACAAASGLLNLADLVMAPFEVFTREVEALLRRAGTRLLILQVTLPEEDLAADFAKLIVETGGLAVLTVVGEDDGTIDRYFTDVYAGICHNRPLVDVARPKDEYRIRAQLWRGRGGDDLVRFHDWANHTFKRMDDLSLQSDELQRRFRYRLPESIRNVEPYLHESAKRHLHDLVQTTSIENEQVSRISEQLKTLHKDLDYSKETGALLPLARISRKLPGLEESARRASSVNTSIEKTLSKAMRSAPRVLNANFADTKTGKLLGKREALVSGWDYLLFVDVGPRWDKVDSIVQGNAEFPERAIPPDKEGIPIEVVLISEHTIPEVSSAWMWLPRSAGRSVPLNGPPKSKDNKRPTKWWRAQDAGPVRIGVTPRVAPHDGRATARLCLYYEGNLLQSGALNFGIVNPPGAVALDRDNELVIDFALTNTLQEVDRKYRKRNVWFTDPVKEREGHSVKLSLALNDDGQGTHRIIAKGRQTDNALPPGWLVYKPQAALGVLKAAREELLNCFYFRDQNGFKTDSLATNGKNRNQFKFDLRELAKIGARIFNMVVGDIRPADRSMSQAEWTRKLLESLAAGTVIQIARTTSADYVLPWSLIYDLPLKARAEITFCKIIDEEWSEQGVRDKPMRDRCPYAAEDRHQESIICPYSFWGLKHIVEQPPGYLIKTNGDWNPAEAINVITTGPSIDLAVGVTRDRALNKEKIKDHLNVLGSISRFHCNRPFPAEDIETARVVLASPHVVYFLCHGEVEKTGLHQPYIGIGPREDDRRYKIFPDTIQDWAITKNVPNLAEWSKRHPLVFINGCETTNLTPDQMLSFVTGFNYAQASGVIGTEVSVLLDQATEIAERLLRDVSAGIKLGVAMRQMRWNLANKGSLIGLAYTLFAMADLHAPS